MSAEAINYYYSKLGLPVDYWQVYYSFDGVSGSNLPSQSGGFLNKTGVVTGGTFSIYNGSGQFNGDSSIRIQNPTGDLTNWTILFKMRQTPRAEGVIFTNFSSGVVNSGFALGVNSSNRLYVESYDENGPVVITSNTILGYESIVSVSKTSNGIYFDYFNANSKNIESTKFEISDKSFLNSNNWFLGGYTGSTPPAYFSGKNFNGYLDDFMLLGEAIRPDEIKQLFKGFYSTMTSGVPVVNSGYLGNLGMTTISYLKPVTTGDYQSLWFSTSTYKTNANLDAIFDRTVGEFYADKDIVNSGVVGYMNGLVLFPAFTHTVNGGFYNPTYEFSGDYIPSGRKFFSSQRYQNVDRVVYDMIGASLSSNMFTSGNFTHNGSSNTTITYNGSGLVFFNGIKLTPSVDYIANSSSYVFQSGNSLYDGATGALVIVKPLAGYSQIYDGYFKNDFSLYSRGTSLFWLNGVRQNLGDDYFETTTGDFLNGQSQAPFNSDRIFTDEYTFIN